MGETNRHEPTAGERASLLERLIGAPHDVLEICQQFLEQPQDRLWKALAHHLISRIPTGRRQFQPLKETGKVAVGFIHPRKNKSSQQSATLKLGYKVYVLEHDTGKQNLSPQDLITVKPGEVIIHADLPLSIIWSDLPYLAAISFMVEVANQYEENTSQVKLFEQQIAPLGNNLVAELDRQIKDHNASISGHEQDIRGLVRLLLEANRAKAAILSGSNIREVAKGLVKLLEDGVYAEINIEGNRVLAKTNDIVISHDGYDYEMGRYDITLSVQGAEEGRVKFYHNPPTWDAQQRLRIAGYLHPHILSDGAPCLGNYLRAIQDQVLQRRFHDVLVILMDFLCSYNPSSPYRELEYWMKDKDFASWSATGRVPQRHEAAPVQELDLSHLEAQAERSGGIVVIPPRQGEELTATPAEAATSLDLRMPASFAGDYGRCWDLAQEVILQGQGSLPCLRRPYGEICDRCPRYRQPIENRPEMTRWDACRDLSNLRNCMGCHNIDCPHLPSRERECLDEQLQNAHDLVSENAQLLRLACVVCPFDHRLCPSHSDRFTTCWGIQSEVQENRRACNGCTVQACPHHPSRHSLSAS